MSKKNIQAIFPLSFMQKALLFHKLHQETDQGFLQVECRIEGSLNTDFFSQAWQLVTNRHEVFRTSIHWEKMDKQVQIVQKNVSLPIEQLDWSTYNIEKVSEKLQEQKKKNSEKGLDLSKAPVSNITLIKINATAHHLIWTCHHILFDGWSSAIVLQDVLSYYESLINNKSTTLPTLPSQKDYISTITNTDKTTVKEFWKKELADFNAPHFFKPANRHESKDKSELKTICFKTPPEDTSALNAFLKNNRLTLNTALQGIWALVLSKYSNSNKVAFGTTVSGRSINLPNIDKMVGLFANLLPVLYTTKINLNLAQWLQEAQDKHLEARKFEQISITELSEWTKWSGNSSLFDTLLIVENFPWSSFPKSSLNISNFSSGITTAYPLTLTVIPGEEIDISLMYSKELISESEAGWFLKAIQQTLNCFLQEKDIAVHDILKTIQSPPISNVSSSISPGNDEPFAAPTNNTELITSKIWESLLGTSTISVTDNFFTVGGDSLLAIRLIHKIKQEMDYQLSVSDLIQNGSIRGISKLISKDNSSLVWSHIVPLKTSGSKRPIFCIHSGGGYVFFYKGLSKELGENRPVYGIQPKGLNGEAPHASISEMVKTYINEMKQVQPEGPYHILGYCMSSVIVLEMARQLKAEGNSSGCLFILDSYAYPWYYKHNKENNWSLKDRLKKQGFKVIKTAVNNRFKKVLGIQEKSHVFNKTLVALHNHIWKLFKEYDWKAITDPIILIRSSEYASDDEKGYHIEGWTHLSTNQLKTDLIESSHDELLKAPNVSKVVTSINKFLQDFESQPQNL